MQQRRFQAVIWDIDGILIDSEPVHYLALQGVCSRMGFTVDDSENAALLGMGLPDMWEVLGKSHRLHGTAEEWIAAITREYLERISADFARPGAVAAVSRLSGWGVPLAAVSTAERVVVEANLAAVGLRHMMQVVVAREDVTRTKPAPEPYLRASDVLGVAPEFCLAIEDTPTGIASAKASGMFVVCWPNALTRSLDLSCADLVVESLTDIPWRQLVDVAPLDEPRWLKPHRAA
jgi:HAD superfamily hydrolase (TIGR01509 family)